MRFGVIKKMVSQVKITIEKLIINEAQFNKKIHNFLIHIYDPLTYLLQESDELTGRPFIWFG